MQAGHAAATAAAAQAIAQSDRWEVLTETRDVVGRKEHALVFASPADGDERHFFIDELAECSADLAGVAVASAHENALAPRAKPLAAVLRIDELTAKAIAELFGVLALGKAKDVHIRAVSIKRRATRGERQSLAEDPRRRPSQKTLAEEMSRLIIAAGAAISGMRHLMRPTEFASESTGGFPALGSRPRSRYLLGRGRAFAEPAGGVGAVISDLEQKGNILPSDVAR